MPKEFKNEKVDMLELRAQVQALKLEHDEAWSQYQGCECMVCSSVEHIPGGGCEAWADAYDAYVAWRDADVKYDIIARFGSVAPSRKNSDSDFKPS